MYLKSLQLIGFKSFAEKTSLEFVPGVTAIVGPNGCGKSNVADAIRWVLGEQSAKALRGSEMADVIFSGTDGRKPVSVAEVNMTFADVDASCLSLPGVSLDFNEVTITRRVYRDGTGEYFINKTPCRLRDIQNMFMDTGIGRSSYSLMAQGQIDQILSTHPEDRRTIFEEAAGINKYKHQKKEALRKLEFVEQNLVRLTDIIKEVKRQIISLQRQAGKARRYKELFEQLKALDTKLARHRYDLLQADLVRLEAEIAGLTSQAGEYAAEIAGAETQITDFRRRLSEIDRAIANTSNRDHDLRRESDRHQQRIGTNRERIAESHQTIESHRREIVGLEEKIRIQEQELARLQTEWEQATAQWESEQAMLRDRQDALKALETELAQQQRGLDEAKAALIEIEQRIAQDHNELNALDQRKRNDKIRAERLSAERLQLEEQRAAHQRQLEEFERELNESRAALEPLRTAIAERESALSVLSQQLSDSAARHRAAEAEASKKSARLEVLQQFFGAPDGHRTLGQILEVEPPYGSAVEATLYHALHTILADDLATARALLAGNAVTAPELLAATDNGPTVADGAVSALAVVRVRDARFEPLIRSLLANVVIAETLDAALRLRAAHPGLAVATREGQFLDAHGVLRAVATSHIAEIGALSAELAALQAQAAQWAVDHAQGESRRAALEQELNALRAELHSQEVAVATKTGEFNSLTTEQRDLESKIHTVLFELQSLEQQDQEDRDCRQRIQADLQEAEARQQHLREQVAQAQRRVEELTHRRNQLQDEVTELRIRVGGLEHKRRSIEDSREPTAGRLRDARERMQVCAEEIQSHTARIAQFETEIAESEQRLAEIETALAQVQQQAGGLEHQRREVAEAVEHAEAELKSSRQNADEIQKRKSGLDVELAKKRMEADQLKETVRQKYQVNLEEVAPDAITITLADQAPVVTEQVPRDTDWSAVEAQVAEMQAKLDAMGPVNVEAIHEYDELEERYRHLTQQHEDLVKAKEQLLQIITKINATTKQLFQETFEKVRSNFQQVFTELFGGGKANLLLLDENDPLESGIEIVAKPPGKQLQSISLLSGGERALTATALLFAIYMVKPSPFCVLDELDAPLDESNINRFIRILQRFVHQSQFIIITHNKRTIAMADALYGITMEEHGVSKVVSVKFTPHEEAARRELERAREAQEDRIDQAPVGPDSATGTTVSAPPLEEIRNDLLVEKESTLAPITDTAPVVPETAPVLGQSAPEELKAEVQAAVAEAEAVAEVVQQTVQETKSEPKP